MKKTNRAIIDIVIYVDDLIITRHSDVDIFDFKKLLRQMFEMKDLGEFCYFLGMEVIQLVTTKVMCLEQIVQIWDYLL